MKKKQPAAERFTKALDIPLDVMLDLPKIEFSGRSGVTVENFRGILDYCENCLKVNTRIGIVEISGENIVIESITDEEVVVNGHFSGMRFI